MCRRTGLQRRAHCCKLFPKCQCGPIETENALIGSVQQYDAETGSSDEGPEPDVLPAIAPSPVSLDQIPMQ